MKSSLLIAALPALFASSVMLAAPAFAEASDTDALAQCRADLSARFEPGSIRSTRIGEIAGNSRRTRVTIYVNADRRYTFNCTADANGQVLTASIDPARSGARLAAGQR